MLLLSLLLLAPLLLLLLRVASRPVMVCVRVCVCVSCAGAKWMRGGENRDKDGSPKTTARNFAAQSAAMIASTGLSWSVCFCCAVVYQGFRVLSFPLLILRRLEGAF